MEQVFVKKFESSTSWWHKNMPFSVFIAELVKRESLVHYQVLSLQDLVGKFFDDRILSVHLSILFFD